MKEIATAFFILIFVFSIVGIVFAFFVYGIPFIEKFSAEERFKSYVHQKCIEGNETAILIKRYGISYYRDDKELVKAAIFGNQHAIKALKLDNESQKKRY